MTRGRRWAAWAVAAPLALTGSQVAHALAYRIVYPSLPIRLNVMTATGHGYVDRLPLVCGLAAAIAVCVLVWSAVDAARGGAPRPLPPAALALLPLLGFALQELIERWLVVGGFPWWVVLQPTFRIGLLLQIPFALLAFAAARLLLRAAHRLGRRLRPSEPPHPARRRAPAVRIPRSQRPRWTVPVATRPLRGPPPIAC